MSGTAVEKNSESLILTEVYAMAETVHHDPAADAAWQVSEGRGPAEACGEQLATERACADRQAGPQLQKEDPVIPHNSKGPMRPATYADRGTSGVLQWINEAEAAGRPWARNALVAFGALVAVLLVALRLGWLGP